MCARVRSILGDSSEAPDLLEKAVASVSRSLDRNGAAPHDPSGLLIVEVRRSAQRLAGRRRREPAVGGTSEPAESLKAPDWSDAVPLSFCGIAYIDLLYVPGDTPITFLKQRVKWL